MIYRPDDRSNNHEALWAPGNTLNPTNREARLFESLGVRNSELQDIKAAVLPRDHPDTESSLHPVCRLKNGHGYFRAHIQFPSKALEANRDVYVFLPHEYKEDRNKRFPVLYLHDGQNVFDSIGNGSRERWGVESVLSDLVGAGLCRNAIIVGIAHGENNRANEYTLVKDEKYACGGNFEKHERFVIRELKPLIDDIYRTLPGPTDTIVGGSSLGGWAALALRLRNPEEFDNLLAHSATLWWGNEHAKEMVSSSGSIGGRSYLDVCSAESPRLRRCFDEVTEILKSKTDLHAQMYDPAADERDGHNELSWSRRLREALPVVLPRAA